MFHKTSQNSNWTHYTNTSHGSGTIGVVEGAARLVKEGTAASLNQSGLPDEWSDCAMEVDGSLRYVLDKMADGKTANEQLGDAKFERPMIPR